MNNSDPRNGSHPSQSIPDAAYPDDSPFRPSTAGLSYTSNIQLQPFSTQSQHASSSSRPAPQGDASMDPPPPYEPIQPAATYTPNTSTQSLHPQPHPVPLQRPYNPYLPPFQNQVSRPTSGGAYKPGYLPVNNSRQRRKNRISSVLVGVCVGIVVAIVIGVTASVVRNKLRD